MKEALVTIRLTEKERDKLNRLAAQFSVSRSAVVRLLIERAKVVPAIVVTEVES